MTEDLSNIFKECEAYLRTALARWRVQLPDLYDDAFQEGMIQCWRDVEAGVDGGETTRLKILRRAAMSANKFVHRNGEYYFGKPRKSRDGLRTNQKTVEKVKIYLEETKGIRQGVWPKPKEVSEALGVKSNSVQKILKDIKEGRVDHMVYREDGRYDWNYYKTMSVEMLSASNDEDKEMRHWTDDPRMPSFSFEDALASDLNMEELLMKLAPKHRTVLYMYFYQGHSAKSIGEWAGHTTNVSTKGARHINSAINQASIILNPYEGACKAGHERREGVTKVMRREYDGIWIRQCLTCQSLSGSATVEKQKKTGFKTGRKERTHCPKGHKKDVRDSRGSLRCSQCRAQAQREYSARKRAEWKAQHEGS